MHYKYVISFFIEYLHLSKNIISFTGIVFKVYGFYSDKNTLGNYIRKARIEMKLTAEELAKQVGCHANVLCLWETDKRIPKMNFLKKLNEIMPIPKMILKQILEKRFSLNEYESNNLFEFELVRNNLMECFRECLKSESTERKTILERYNFKSLFKLFRLSHLMSLKAFAVIIEVQPETIHEWEKGINKPNREMIEKILPGIEMNGWRMTKV